MWIELDDSLISHIQKANETQCMALDAIAASACLGRHVVYGSSAVIDWLKKQDIGPSSKAISQRIKNIRPELGALRSKIESKVIIGSYIDAVRSDDKKVWYISLDALVGNPFASAVLLTENHNDANIYKIAANHYRISIDASAYGLNLNIQGGGGNQIYPTFINIVDEKSNFCLVITDTDKDYPDALSCETSRKCEYLCDSKEWIATHLEVPARELENIIPFNLIADAIYSDGGSVELHNSLRQIEIVKNKKPELLLYSDYKKGTTRYWACGNHGNKERQQYWKILVEEKIGCSNHKCDEICTAKSKDDCSCFLVKSLGEHVADKFLEYARTKNTHETFKRAKTSFNVDQWIAVGRAVFEWGVSMPVNRS